MSHMGCHMGCGCVCAQATTRRLMQLTGEAHDAQHRSRLVGAADDAAGGRPTGKVRCGEEGRHACGV